MSKIIIAIDGHSSTGKSTVAKSLASTLGYIYVDTGAMYRAVALYAIKNKLVNNGIIDVVSLIESLDLIHISFQFNKALGYAEVFLNEENVESQIRGLEVSSLVSKVAAIPQVRKKLVKLQQKLGEAKGVVMDGRDIGTVVFPNAELKLFMTASADVRAKRRYEELLSKGDIVSYEDIYNNVVERDHLDTNRVDSPLIIAKDAVTIDNSTMTRDEQFQMILELVKSKI